MNRPLALRISPERLRMSLYARFYRDKGQKWLPLYTAAPLKHVSGVSMDLIPGDGISDSIAFTGVYEPRLTRRVVQLAQKGGILVDIGANIGYFSLLWTACNSRNESIAFEASPRNIDLLQKNIAQSGLTRQVKVMPVAAGASQGKFQFDLGPAEQTTWGGLTLNRTANSIEVDVVRVDDVVGLDKRIAMLKVDVEGADTWALMGCQRFLEAGAVDEIWYEQNKPRIADLGISVDSAQKYLRSVGYVSYPVNDPNDELVEWFAVPV